jgi:hypothetical protein
MPRRTDIGKSPSPPSGGEGRGEGGVRISAKLNQNGSNYAVEIAENISIGEADHPITSFRECGCPRGIVGLAPGMRIAIEFDDQPFGSGRKIRNVGSENDLLLELHAEAISADDVPQFSFGRGEITAKLLGALSRLGVPFQMPPLSQPSPPEGGEGFSLRHVTNQFHESPFVNA